METEMPISSGLLTRLSALLFVSSNHLEGFWGLDHALALVEALHVGWREYGDDEMAAECVQLWLDLAFYKNHATVTQFPLIADQEPTRK